MTQKTNGNKTVFELQHPFEVRGQNYASFEFRRPRVRDLREFLKEVDKDGVGAIQKVLSNLAEVDDKIMADVDVEDFAPMKKWFENFLKPMIGDSDE